jgi:hypothetical protein
LPGAIDHAHPAAADLFEDLVVTQPPMRIAHGHGSEGGVELFRCELFFFLRPGLQKASEAKIVSDAR